MAAADAPPPGVPPGVPPGLVLYYQETPHPDAPRGHWRRFSIHIEDDDHDPEDDPSGSATSDAFVERLGHRLFAGVGFADHHKGRGLSRKAMRALCARLRKKFGDRQKLYIASDDSEGFWAATGFVPNPDRIPGRAGPEMVNTLERMCAWGDGVKTPNLPPLASRPRKSSKGAIRPPTRLAGARSQNPYKSGGRRRTRKPRRPRKAARKSRRTRRRRRAN